MGDYRRHPHGDRVFRDRRLIAPRCLRVAKCCASKDGIRKADRGRCRGRSELDRADCFHVAVRLHHLSRLRRRALAQGRSRSAARMGPRRPALRHADHLVSDRRRPLYRLYFHRRSGARLRRRRDRVFRGALHDLHLSDPVPGVSAALVCLPQAQLHHAGRFRARPFRQSLAGAGGDDHRHRRDDALYRAAIGRPAGRHRRHGRLGHRLCRRSAADHRLRHSGRLHLFERPARAGVDRHRQGYS